MPDNCSLEGLSPYVPTAAKPWNQQRLLHLYRRLGFSLPFSQIENQLNNNPVSLVQEILDNAATTSLPPAPDWAELNILDYIENDVLDTELYINQVIEYFYDSVEQLIVNPIRDKFALFWSNHFVTQYDIYERLQPLYKYHRELRINAFGNFKTFVQEIGKTPAMLLYLNGAESTALEPNENYARELYELFTLGQDNGYTQVDIEETARALTGWKVLLESNTFFNPQEWDSGMKTIFGQTGNWSYDDVIDILFEQRGELISKFVCEKIYREFVSVKVPENIVAELAETLRTNNFQLLPVYKQLFSSEHFFSDELIGVKIKSPYELQMNFITENEIEVDQEGFEALGLLSQFLGQTLFSPPDVSGWEGHHAWINTADLVGRWDVMDVLLISIVEENPQFFVDIVKDLTNNSNDPVFITNTVVEHLLSRGFNTQIDLLNAVQIFKGEVPENYFTDGTWNLNWDSAPFQVAILLRHIFQQPDYHLN